MTGPVPAHPAASGLSDESIVAMVGPEAFARGLVAVRAGHVSQVETDDEARTVSGRVRGTHRDDYAVTVFLAGSPSGATTVYRSQCTCPVAMDCKHAAAVLVVARHLQPPGPRVERPEWERVLGRLVDAAPPAAGTEVAPLAMELGIERIPANRGYAGRLDLRIRPARRGRSGAWVRSGISWDDLDFVARSYLAEHRELLLQFRAAAGASARYSLPRNAWLSLQTVSSAFWSLLEQAGDVGLALITEKPLSGPHPAPGPASVSLDVRRVPAVGILVGPRVSLAGTAVELTSVGVLGEPAHGVFSVGADDRLSVARLEVPLPRELRALVLGARPLLVPTVDEPRFLRDFVPALRRHAEVTSRDGTVVVPRAVAPQLVLTLTAREEHRLRLDWSVRYVGDEGVAAFALDELPLDGQRDPAAEAELLDALPLPYEELPVLRLDVLDARSGPAPHVLLEGRAVWLFVEQVLPQLRERGVEVITVGDVPGYHAATSDPAVSVSATERADSADWFDLHVAVSVDGEQVPFDRLFVALTQGAEHLVLDSGVYFTLERPVFDRLRSLIEESRALADHDPDDLRINRYQVSLWQDLVELGVVGEQASRWTRTVRGLGGDTPVEPVEVPAAVHAELRPYQRDGYAWLWFLYSHGLGGILADDMGLGKTLQTLALVARARAERSAGEPGADGPAPPFLVVAPTSVVGGWASEAARFTPSLRVVCLTGSQARRRRPLSEVVAGADLVVTSYTLLRLGEDEVAALPWSGLVLDEAQFVKNHRAKTYQAARRVDTAFKLAITGTPLENSLMDLWSLLSITAPGLFGSPQRFSQFYRRPIERDRDGARLQQLQRRIRPFLLRRTKQGVATELPAKQEQVLEVELEPRHMRVYQTYLQRERQKVLGLIDDLDRNRFTILRSLTLLRRLSLDAALVDEVHEGIPAAKVEMLLDDLAELTAEGHRALVFSQFTSFLARVRSRLDAAGISHAYLDGATTHRDQVVERFRSGAASVFLISLKAGGFGLNLTEADYCFVLDPWWNPAAEAQAVDRAHRIGQTRKVMVYRMVAKDTIEEKVMALKARKSELFGSVFGDGGLGGAGLTAEEIRALLVA